MPDDHNGNRPGPSASIALAMLLAGVVGGSLGLLLAPDSGRRTRERLRDLVGEAHERTLDAVAEVRERLGDVFDQGRALVEANKAAADSAYEAGREAFHRERQRLQELQGQGHDGAARGAAEVTPSTPEGPVSIA